MQAFGEEIEVLEEAEHAQVEHHAQGEDAAPGSRAFDSTQPEAAGIVDDRRENEQREEPGVPAGVEVIARRQQQDVLGRAPLAQEPVRRQERREEEGERVGVESHAMSSSVRRRNCVFRSGSVNWKVEGRIGLMNEGNARQECRTHGAFGLTD